MRSILSDPEFLQPLHELGSELTSYRFSRFRAEYDQITGGLAGLREGASDTNLTSDAIAYMYELSLELIERGGEFPDLAPEPRFELTRRTLQFSEKLADKRGTPEMPTFEQNILDIDCPEIELRFERALTWHESGEIPDVNHPAGVVLFDSGGSAFAYQKSSGYPTAFVWRDIEIDTAAGPRWLPAGSIVRPIYHAYVPNAGPHWGRAGDGLIGLQPPTLDDVTFVRFGTCCLPPELREPFLRLGVEQTEKLAENLEGALQLDEQTTARRVAKLINSKNFILLHR
jgi:hypothetical protein